MRFPVMAFLVSCTLFLACAEDQRRYFGAPCTANGDCESNLCAEGRCTMSCVTSATCGSQVCVQHTCKPVTAIACATATECLAHVSGAPCRVVGCSSAGFCALDALADGAACKLDACKAAGSCQAGACVTSQPPPSCDDGLACTIDVCDPQLGCQHIAHDASCDDLVACTEDRCTPVEGCLHTGSAAACDDLDPCTVESCDAAGCHHQPKCDDGNKCTQDECFGAGICIGGAAIGAPCEDGNACTFPDVCTLGSCETGPLMACDDGNPCTADGCDASTGCKHAALDGNPCVGLCGVGTCAAGVCQGTGTTFTVQSPGGSTVDVLVNGDQIVAAGAQSPVKPAIWAVDGAGAPLWSSAIGLQGLGAVADLERLASGYVVTGINFSGAVRGWVAAVDAKGKSQWLYQSAAPNTELVAVAAAGDGAFACGRKTQGAQALWLVHLDGDGDELSTATWSTGESAAAAGLVPAGAGFLIVGHSKAVGGRQVGLVQRWALDAALPTWSVTIGGTIDRRLSAIAPVENGWLALGSEGANADHVWLVRLDAIGQVVWQTVGAKPRVPARLVVDGAGAWLVGARNDLVAGPTAWLGRYDLWGNERYERALAGWTQLTGLGVWPDGGLAVSGMAGEDGRLARLTPWAHATCAASGKCAAIVVGACDDGIACTADDCDAALGCTHKSLSNEAICGSAGPCTLAHCAGQACAPTAADSCVDADPCTLDVCKPTGCSHVTAPDGTPCLGAATCKAGVCGP